MLQMRAKMQVSQSSVAVGVPLQHGVLLHDVYPEYRSHKKQRRKSLRTFHIVMLHTFRHQFLTGVRLHKNFFKTVQQHTESRIHSCILDP